MALKVVAQLAVFLCLSSVFCCGASIFCYRFCSPASGLRIRNLPRLAGLQILTKDFGAGDSRIVSLYVSLLFHCLSFQ